MLILAHISHLHKTVSLANTPIDEIRTIPVQIDQSQPLVPQVRAIVDAIQLTSQQWQTRPLLFFHTSLA